MSRSCSLASPDASKASVAPCDEDVTSCCLEVCAVRDSLREVGMSGVWLCSPERGQRVRKRCFLFFSSFHPPGSSHSIPTLGWAVSWPRGYWRDAERFASRLFCRGHSLSPYLADNSLRPHQVGRIGQRLSVTQVMESSRPSRMKLDGHRVSALALFAPPLCTVSFAVCFVFQFGELFI